MALAIAAVRTRSDFELWCATSMMTFNVVPNHPQGGAGGQLPTITQKEALLWTVSVSCELSLCCVTTVLKSFKNQFFCCRFAFASSFVVIRHHSSSSSSSFFFFAGQRARLEDRSSNILRHRFESSGVWAIQLFLLLLMNDVLSLTHSVIVEFQLGKGGFGAVYLVRTQIFSILYN